MRESVYQRNLKNILEEMFPGCFILKNDPEHFQGIPDLIILFGNKWAMLEVKQSSKAPKQPNQEYYLNLLNRMSFAAVIYPENEREVLNGLYEAFHS